MTDADAPRRRRRRWPHVLAAVAVLLGVAGALGWHFRVPVANQAASLVLDAFDIGETAGFRVAEIGANRVRLEDVRFGREGPGAKAAELTFTADELAQGRIRTIRLIEPTLAIVETADGGFEVRGAGARPGAGAPDTAPANADAGFPRLPDIAEIEIIDGRLTLATSWLTASGPVDGKLVRLAPGRFRLDLVGSLTDAAGQSLILGVPGADIAYAPDRIVAAGRIDAELAGPDRAANAEAAVWLDADARPDGAVTLDATVMSAAGRYGDRLRVGDARGRIRASLSADGPPSARVDLNLADIGAPPGAAALLAVVAEVRHGALSLTAEAVGDSGHLALTLDAPQARDKVAATARGEVDAAVIAALLPDIASAAGRVRFVADATTDGDPLAALADVRRLTGAAEINVELPKLSIPGLAPDGSALGQVSVALAGGAATLTSPGLRLGGVILPAATLASLPPDIRRAFAEPAFLRLGGPGLADTVVTLSERPEGGLAAVGKLGLGLSNPRLAIFFEGDAAIATDADGAVAHVESERLTVRMVDASIGPAQISGRMELAGLSGAGQTFAADAALALSGGFAAGGYKARRADIELSGPLAITAAAATLTPNPGGRIRIGAFAGPLLATLKPVGLTLTRGGARRIVYDRLADTFDVALNFRGFKTRAALGATAGDKPAEFDLALAGAGVSHGPQGSVLTLKGASAEFPDHQIAVEGGDARIALGARRAQTGRLTVKAIRHLAPEPMLRPLSLRLDVTGRGDRLTFDGAVIAAGDRARLTMAGEHHLKTGLGAARLSLGPMVFAPGLLQPQDFAPRLYRTLLETIGAATTEAAVSWGPDGLTGQDARLNLSVDKIRTSELEVERLVTDFRLDRLFPPRSAGPQRLRIGRLNIGVPVTLASMRVNLVSPERIEVTLDRAEFFGGTIESQRLTIDPTRNRFEAVLNVSNIDLASILAFAEFGELQATGKLEGQIPLVYEAGELRIDGGLLKTGAGGGRLKYKPRQIDKALSDNDRSSGLAIKALANFAYDEISIKINEQDAEELRLDIFIAGKSLDLYDGVPFEFNIVIEGPLRQIIQENLAPPQLPPEVQDLLDRATPADAKVER